MNKPLRFVVSCGVLALLSVSVAGCGALDNSSDNGLLSDNSTTDNTQPQSPQATFVQGFANIDSSINVDPSSVQYVTTHPQWFPASKSDTSYEKVVNHGLTIPMLMKDQSPYYHQMYQNTGVVIDIHQYHDPEYAQIQVAIDSPGEVGDQAMILYEGSTGSIVQGSEIRFVGLPVSEYDFDNVSGGQTKSILFDGVSLQNLS